MCCVFRNTYLVSCLGSVQGFLKLFTYLYLLLLLSPSLLQYCYTTYCSTTLTLICRFLNTAAFTWITAQMKCEKDFRPTEKRNVSVSIALQQSVVWCRWSAPEIIKLVISQLLLLPGLSQHLWWFIFLTSTLTIKLDTSYTQCLYFHFLFAFYCWFIKYKALALWKMFFLRHCNFTAVAWSL